MERKSLAGQLKEIIYPLPISWFAFKEKAKQAWRTYKAESERIKKEIYAMKDEVMNNGKNNGKD